MLATFISVRSLTWFSYWFHSLGKSRFVGGMNHDSEFSFQRCWRFSLISPSFSLPFVVVTSSGATTFPACTQDYQTKRCFITLLKAPRSSFETVFNPWEIILKVEPSANFPIDKLDFVLMLTPFYEPRSEWKLFESNLNLLKFTQKTNRCFFFLHLQIQVESRPGAQINWTSSPTISVIQRHTAIGII